MKMAWPKNAKVPGKMLVTKISAQLYPAASAKPLASVSCQAFDLGSYPSALSRTEQGFTSSS